MMLAQVSSIASPVARPVAAGPAVSASGWPAFLQQARAVSNATVMQPVGQAPTVDSLPAGSAVPLKRAVLLVPRHPDAGLAKAIADLAGYCDAVTGKPVQQIVYDAGRPVDLSRVPAGASVIALGTGSAVNGLIPPASGQAQGYAIRATTIQAQGRTIPVVGVNGDDALGRQYGVYRLMSLSGKRFYEYDDTYTPAVGQASLPASGFSESYAPPANMQTRGFAPHQYHPTPLSVAFHEPSAAHRAEIEKYLDWCVENGQNSVKFELLNLDAPNRFLPFTPNHKKFNAWLPYARQILDYAHARGLKVSVNVAFANDVSNNPSAVNPLVAIAQSLGLDAKERRVAKDQRALDAARPGPAKAAARSTLRRDTAAYQRALAKASTQDAPRIHALVDRLMQAPWDDISWCLGTSEFSSTNDDLTIGWMNEAAAHLKRHYPQTTTTVISHVPGTPYSQKYQTPYFNLVEHADPAVGQLVHTTEIYSLTDPAPVYGNQTFENKLKQLYQADPARRTIFEPETSYWVSYDASVPLFLPVYMLSRAKDMAMIKGLPNIAGQETFTTSWEWGYWLSDYAVARMQTNPNESLTSILKGAFAPFGPAQGPAVTLMQDAMASQQKHLIEAGLIKDVQGFGGLTEFGAAAQKIPGLNQLLQGTNSAPVRTRPADILTYSAEQLAAFQAGELAQLARMTADFRTLADRAVALRGSVPPAGRRYFDELADGLAVNALRAEEVRAALTASVDARRAQLTRDPRWRERGLAELANAEVAMRQAMALIHAREAHYRTPAAETYGPAKGPTMWNDRYLTPVHTGEYWKNTYNEVAKLYR